MTAVSSAPAIIAGAKLRTNLRPGPVRRGTSARRALRRMATEEMASERSASPSQTPSQRDGVGCRAATAAAARALRPTATVAQPEMAVNAPARSIVSRMKRRSSMARSWSAGASGVSAGRDWTGRTGGMRIR
jgi:hypothetical protein